MQIQNRIARGGQQGPSCLGAAANKILFTVLWDSMTTKLLVVHMGGGDNAATRLR